MKTRMKVPWLAGLCLCAVGCVMPASADSDEGAWTFTLFSKVLGVPLAAIALGAAPLSVVWLGIGLVLGRQQRKLAGEEPDAPAPARVRPGASEI